MKKFLSVVLIGVMIFLCGCAGSTKRSEADVDALLKEYLDNLDKYETQIHEYGEAASYIQLDDNFAIGIFYPETGEKFLDDAIFQWIENKVQECTQDLDDLKNPDVAAELTVSYESYKVGKNTVSIRMTGIFSADMMAHPIDIVETFNADLEKKELFNVGDAIREEKRDAFIELLADKEGVDKADIDGHFLDKGIFTEDGMEIILERGDYLPMSAGTRKASFTYEEIASYLREDFDHYPEKAKDVVEKENIKEEKKDAVDIDPDKPMIALTFDDGPSVHTERLLDVFKENGGQGTFFVLGNLIEGKERILKRAVKEGHEIGNHSWNHSQLTNLSEADVKDQIMKTKAKIYKATGEESNIMRPPYGAYNDMVLEVAGNLDVSFVNWSIDTLDWKNKDPEAIYNEIITNASDGDIILCHDLHATTVDAMETVIPKLIESGYQLVTVSQLMEYSQDGLQPGKIYFKQ